MTEPAHPPTPGQLTAFDVFAGAGGLTAGLRQAGFKVIGAVEIDPTAADTYEQNHPEVVLWKQDIQTLEVTEVLHKLRLTPGELDLLAGCPPCQGFSSMRTRNGSIKVEDPRNDLVRDFLRLVEGLRPKAVMMENVPDLAKDVRMMWIMDKLSELGYYAGSDSVEIRNVKDFEVPQSRRRLILMTSLQGKVIFPEQSKKKLTVRGAIGHLPSPQASEDPMHRTVMKNGSKVLEMIEAVPLNGGSRSDLPEEMQLECHKRLKRGYFDVYGRMAWDDVAPTITGGCTNPSKGRFLHPQEHRAISLREAALLQGFPEDYKFSLKRGRVVASLMIGNALPPAFVKHHAMAIVQTLKTTQTG